MLTGLGYADVENRLPCTSNSVHRIASISKSFTMAAVAKLWEEGKLDIDKPVQFYLPEFPEKEVDGEQVHFLVRGGAVDGARMAFKGIRMSK